MKGQAAFAPHLRPWRLNAWCICVCLSVIMSVILSVCLYVFGAILCWTWVQDELNIQPKEHKARIILQPRTETLMICDGHRMPKHYITLQFITVHHNAFQCIALNYNELGLHYIRLKCITLHWKTLYYTILKCIAMHSHYDALKCITLLYISLQCITLKRTA